MGGFKKWVGGTRNVLSGVRSRYGPCIASHHSCSFHHGMAWHGIRKTYDRAESGYKAAEGLTLATPARYIDQSIPHGCAQAFWRIVLHEVGAIHTNTYTHIAIDYITRDCGVLKFQGEKSHGGVPRFSGLFWRIVMLAGPGGSG